MRIGRRMLVASVVLALLVAGAFAALIFAVSTLRVANEREARSKEVTEATLQLQKLVVDLETGLRGFTLTGNRRLLQPYTRGRRSAASAAQTMFLERASIDSDQLRRATRITRLISRTSRTTPARDRARAREPRGRQLGAGDDRGKSADRRDPRALRPFLAEERQLARSAARDGGQSLRPRNRRRRRRARRLHAPDPPLRRAPRPCHRQARSGRCCRGDRLAKGDLSFRLPTEGPGEIGELTRSFNTMAEELRARERRARAAEREAPRERAAQDRADHDRLARVADATRERPRLHLAPAPARLRPAGAAALPGDHRRPGTQARRAPRGLPRRAADRGRPARAGPGSRRHGRAPRRAGRALSSPEPEAPAQAGAARKAAAGSRRREQARPGRRQPPLERDQVFAGWRRRRARRSARGRRGAGSASGTKGLGIASDQQSRIFTKFFRGEASRSGIGGTGLGLAVSREIVEAHGGRIGFSSTAGSGSTFWLELPTAAGFGADAARKGQAGSERKETHS